MKIHSNFFDVAACKCVLENCECSKEQKVPIEEQSGLSNRSDAAVASAVLADFGLVTAVDSSSVIDKSKIRRERKKTRTELNAQQKFKSHKV